MKRRLSIHTLYRVCIWLPILVPAFVILCFRTLALRPADFIIPEILLYSLVYGGIPYAALAAWATWWVALVAGLATAALQPFLAVAVLGAAVTLPLGYVCVGLAVLLRHLLGPAPQ